MAFFFSCVGKGSQAETERRSRGLGVRGRFLALVFVSVLEHLYHSFASPSDSLGFTSVGTFEPLVFTGATPPKKNGFLGFGSLLEGLFGHAGADGAL